MLNKFFGLIALVCFLSTGAFSQIDKALIYGTVSTIDGNKYTGQIRWGDEETFWVDEFNSTKIENPYNRWVKNDKIQEMKFKDDDGEWAFMSLWKDNNCCDYHFNKHQFVCRFGDIKTLEPTGRSEVTLTFKDDSKMNVSGGSNDIGATIRVLDSEIGDMKIRWDRVNRVDFKEGPAKLEKKIGEPMYGKLKTMRGEFEGFIQWDHEECLSVDKIDGHNNNGKISLDMGDIRKIEKFGRGSKITLKSGREIELFNTNDVDASNRGIVARTKDFGKVLVEWRDFEYVEFMDNYKDGATMKYSDFDKPKRIKGIVNTVADKSVEGLIVYDIDETYDYELLEGNDYEIKYSIPFRDIKEITPKNYNYCTVSLKSGKSVLIGDSQDVSDRNDGIMIFKSENDEEPVLVPWKAVKDIKIQ